ncbi:sorbitol dehydrogenase family protein [Paraburkholderia hayleyella]|uniref:sorbitol dehydrogenase family protein n=1 Tax=Paraburkholderia hayleyella TaxID=2152889 RepID=UPI001FEC5C38|nr:sorbitol dehydrogenase family protein [Paraburkholderia hayleyella]
MSFSFSRTNASPSRRTWLLGACASAALLSFTVAAGRFGLPAAWAEPAPTDDTYPALLAVSQHLSARQDLNPVLARRIHDALSQADSLFARHVSALDQWLKSHEGMPADSVIATLQTHAPELAVVARAILRAWYLGLIGEMPQARVVAFEQALMFEPVKDVLTIPSYCHDVPFYWTNKPVHA